MKLNSLIYLASLCVLGYLAFVDNLSINIGDEYTYISQEEWFESNHLDMKEFNKSSGEENTDLIDLQDFYRFIKEMSEKAFYRHDIAYLDTTGDGEKEGVHSIVNVQNETCTVTNYIEKNNKVLWKDEFLITKELAVSYTGNRDFVDNYGAYALFYLGQVGSNFAEKLEKNRLFDQRKKYLLRSQQGTQSLYQRYNSSLSTYMENYKGMYLFRLNDGMQPIYMWDKNKSQFICIHRNNPLLS